MKEKSIPQARYIGGRSREEAVEEFNAAMIELAALRPRYERDGEGFYIYYDVKIKESEGEAEAHELRGEKHRCQECGNCVRSLNRYGYIDARKKRATCSLTGELIRIDQAVCDEFYGGNDEE